MSENVLEFHPLGGQQLLSRAGLTLTFFRAGISEGSSSIPAEVVCVYHNDKSHDMVDFHAKSKVGKFKPVSVAIMSNWKKIDSIDWNCASDWSSGSLSNNQCLFEVPSK